MDSYDSYRLLLFLHIVAIIVALGSTFALPFLQGFAQRKGVGATRLVLQFDDYLGKFVITPGAVLVFLFGLGLYFNDTTGYKDSHPAWLSVSMVWFVVAFVVSLVVQRPAVLGALRALEGVADGAPLPEAYKKFAVRTQIVGGLLGLSIMGIAFLMVWKPGN
jgi:uncharacterized membrane protein